MYIIYCIIKIGFDRYIQTNRLIFFILIYIGLARGQNTLLMSFKKYSSS